MLDKDLNFTLIFNSNMIRTQTYFSVSSNIKGAIIIKFFTSSNLFEASFRSYPIVRLSNLIFKPRILKWIKGLSSSFIIMK